MIVLIFFQLWEIAFLLVEATVCYWFYNQQKRDRSGSNGNALFRTPTLAGSNNQEYIASDVSMNDTVDFGIVICHAMPGTVVCMTMPCAGSSSLFLYLRKCHYGVGMF